MTHYHFVELPGKKSETLLAVSVTRGDGTRAAVGTVRKFYIRHLEQRGWEATGADGAHLAVHKECWQAAWALTWDRTGYPFPVAASHKRKMTGV